MKWNFEKRQSMRHQLEWKILYPHPSSYLDLSLTVIISNQFFHHVISLLQKLIARHGSEVWYWNHEMTPAMLKSNCCCVEKSISLERMKTSPSYPQFHISGLWKLTNQDTIVWWRLVACLFNFLHWTDLDNITRHEWPYGGRAQLTFKNNDPWHFSLRFGFDSRLDMQFWCAPASRPIQSSDACGWRRLNWLQPSGPTFIATK